MRIARLCVGALIATLLSFVTPAPAQAADGDFIRVAEHDGAIYQIVGGAPVHVSSWAAIGHSTQQPFTSWSPADFDRLPPYPADGTVVNDAVNTYRYAGGAPLVVTNWANIGGEVPSRRIDPGAIARPGTARWTRLRMQPLEGTQIVGWLPGDPEHGSVFVIAGGAPVYVSDFAAVGGSRNPVVVDMLAIRNAGNGEAAYQHLSYHPAEGTQVHAGSTCYTITSGAPIAGATGTCGTRIDPAAVAKAGQPGRWSHLKAPPPPPPPPPVPPVPAPVPAPVVRTVSLTVIKKSKLKVDIGPDAAGADYEFFVQIRSRRKWRTIVGALTSGPRDVKRIDLPRGKYRVLLPGSTGAPPVISGAVKLRR